MKPLSDFPAYRPHKCTQCNSNYNKTMYQKNPQKYIDYAEAYRADNPGKRNAAVRKWRTFNPEKAMYSGLKGRAKNLGVPFNLELSDIVIPNVCPALGIPLDKNRPDRSKRPDNIPSLDRLIPALGYVRGNVYIISFRANRIKQNATSAELIGIADYIRDHYAGQTDKGES